MVPAEASQAGRAPSQHFLGNPLARDSVSSLDVCSLGIQPVLLVLLFQRPTCFPGEGVVLASRTRKPQGLERPRGRDPEDKGGKSIGRGVRELPADGRVLSTYDGWGFFRMYRISRQDFRNCIPRFWQCSGRKSHRGCNVVLGLETQKLGGQRMLNPNLKVYIIFKIIPQLRCFTLIIGIFEKCVSCLMYRSVQFQESSI